MTDKTIPHDLQPRKFGTFGGVFTPSFLTIVGVIMFLRFSNIVGYAGLWNALLILLGAKLISLITGLSIASIATNMRVKGGGAYYLVSRSLGVEFGGVIAVFFYIAQTVSSGTLCCFVDKREGVGSLEFMPRQGRIDAPGAVPHMIIRGIERKGILENDRDREDILERLSGLLP